MYNVSNVVVGGGHLGGGGRLRFALRVFFPEDDDEYDLGDTVTVLPQHTTAPEVLWG